MKKGKTISKQLGIIFIVIAIVVGFVVGMNYNSSNLSPRGSNQNEGGYPPGFTGKDGAFYLFEPVLCGGNAEIPSTGEASVAGVHILMHTATDDDPCDSACQDSIQASCNLIIEQLWESALAEAREECERLESSLPGGADADPQSGDPMVEFDCKCSTKQSPGTECNPSSGWEDTCGGFYDTFPPLGTISTVENSDGSVDYYCDLDPYTISMTGTFKLTCDNHGCPSKP